MIVNGSVGGQFVEELLLLEELKLLLKLLLLFGFGTPLKPAFAELINPDKLGACGGRKLASDRPGTGCPGPPPDVIPAIGIPAEDIEDIIPGSPDNPTGMDRPLMAAAADGPDTDDVLVTIVELKDANVPFNGSARRALTVDKWSRREVKFRRRSSRRSFSFR